MATQPQVSHFMSYDVDQDSYSFTCSGDHASPCHQYPDHSAEYGECDHEGACQKVAHEACWISTWVDADCMDYAGEDRVLCPGDSHNECPPTSRAGEITTQHQIDWVEWDWASSSEPREQS